MQTSMNSAITRCLRFGLHQRVSNDDHFSRSEERRLRGTLDELLPATDVPLVQHEMGQLWFIKTRDATPVVLDEFGNLVETVRYGG